MINGITTITQRMSELDLMRGLAVSFVVFGHIVEFRLTSDSYSIDFMSMVQMPLFFVVSGYFSRTGFSDTKIWCWGKICVE